MSEAEEWAQFAPMEGDERLNFLSLLVQKLAYVLNLKSQGITVNAVEAGVRKQIMDTVISGDPKKL